ncbi:MAG: hypothetical protein PHP08_00410 [Candidatus Dojkabacteria bacterium]|nr:hypothetical protein [Candidatus Dojkabacteria bacterium]
MNYKYNSLQTCTPREQQIIDAIKNKTIDSKLVVSLPHINIYVGDGWYEVSVFAVYILAYVNKSDPNYNYLITVVKTPGITIDCNGITIEKTNKDGTPASDNTLPQPVVDSAISSFPTAATECGTGIWNGCTAGVQNKYLIVGGGVLALLMMGKK